jgi:hypothetical protein
MSETMAPVDPTTSPQQSTLLHQIGLLINNIHEASQQVIGFAGQSQQDRPPLAVWFQLMHQRGEWLAELDQRLRQISDTLDNQTEATSALRLQITGIQAQDRLVQEVFTTQQAWVKQQLSQLKRNKHAVKHYKSDQ